MRTNDKEEGSRSAMKQAHHFCEQIKRTAVVINESQEYTGDMDEKNYQTGKMASKIAAVVGWMTWIFGGKRESDLGAIVALGGTAANAALGKGYTLTMTFRCE